MDISFNISVSEMKSLTGIKQVNMKESVSKIVNKGLSFNFIKKRGNF